MSREEIQKLLGGYATDTLSEPERRALFEAALEDQDLFDALAKEQALREVLEEPAARQQLIAALGPAREPYAVRAWHWLRQPAALAMAGSMAALLIVGGLVLRQTKRAALQKVIVADAIVPRSEPSLAAPQSAAPLAAARKKPFRPPATRITRQLAPLSEPPTLPAQSEVASANLPATSPAPAPPPPRALAVGGLAGVAETKQEVLQTTQARALGFHAGSGATSLKRAKAAPLAASAAAKRAVGYTLLLKGGDGVYAPVPSGAMFHAGDSVRLQVEPNEAGYIFLFQRDAAAGWNLVASQHAEKAQRYALPSTGGLQSNMPAKLELLLVLSRLERPEFAGPQTSEADARLPGSQTQASFKITLDFQ